MEELKIIRTLSNMMIEAEKGGDIELLLLLMESTENFLRRERQHIKTERMIEK